MLQMHFYETCDGQHSLRVAQPAEGSANMQDKVMFVEQRGMQSETEQVPPELESMEEVLLVWMLAMVRNVAVPAQGSVEKLWCDDEGSMAVVLESFP
ncbi:unnamed protein product [Malus baccata var. baccata]